MSSGLGPHEYSRGDYIKSVRLISDTFALIMPATASDFMILIRSVLSLESVKISMLYETKDFRDKKFILLEKTPKSLMFAFWPGYVLRVVYWPGH